MTVASWLRTNKSILEKYTPAEIALLALSVGFDDLDTQKAILVVMDHIIALKRKLDLWDSPLRNHWVDVAFKQSMGIDWDD